MAKNIGVKKQLIEVQPVIDIIELTLQSAFIKPYAPASLILIANPESCKTRSIFFRSDYDFVHYTNEITAKMFIDKVLDKAQKKEIRFLMVPDLLNCIEKQKTSRQQFLNLIKSSIDEGITKIQTYYKQIESDIPIKLGMITAITSASFHDTRDKLKKYLADTGILSRFIPFSYSYPIDKIKRIFDDIEGIAHKQSTFFKKIKCVEKAIKAKPELLKELEILSREIGRQYGAYGIRAQLNLQKLAKANAYIHNRLEVNKSDIDTILKLGKWINFNSNPL